MSMLAAPIVEDRLPMMFPVTRVAPETDQIAHAASLLAAAQRPLIIMGDGIAASSAQAELAYVARQLSTKVWGAKSAKTKMDTMHYKDTSRHASGEYGEMITSQADVVLICGAYIFPEVFSARSCIFATDANIIHIDLNSYEVGKNFSPGHTNDPRTILARLAVALDGIMAAT